LSLCSGYAAVLAAGHPENEALRGTSVDFEEAQELIGFWGLAGDLDKWKTDAVELMRRPENAAAVALVADHLLRCSHLDGDLIDVLLDLADGHMSQEEFEQFLQFRCMRPENSP
jgi:hypothetical protein